MHRALSKISIASACIAIASSAGAQAQSIKRSLRELAPSASLRVIGGTEATEGAWPWYVYINIPIIEKGGWSGCGGSLIATRWVLTAAHCLSSLDESRQVTVFEGLKRITPNGSEYKRELKASNVFVHPHYDFRKSENDIALLRLKDPAKAKVVRPLLTPNALLENPPLLATLIGLGTIKDVEKLDAGGYADPSTHIRVPDTEMLPTRLRQVELPLVDIEECKTQNYGAAVDARNVCAGVPEGGKGSCYGDSGGPLMTQNDDGHWVLIGVTSFGVNGCAHAKHPSVFTRVSSFADWIKSVAGRDLAIEPEKDSGGAPDVPSEPLADPDTDNAAGIEIRFDNGDHVHLGELVSYRVTTKKAGFLVILDASPDGKLTQVFPNTRSLASPAGAGQEAAKITPDRPLLVPDYMNSYRGFNVRITGERGKGMMIAVLSDKPLKSIGVPDSPKTFTSPREAELTIEILRKELMHNLTAQAGNRTGSGLKPNWSIDIEGYVVE
ncbi:MAG: trypsin-like serine protease [Hyphomicrobiales bacterium]|nr:MAG: trypsin-like serine protease [Hyphomicrobiales bacterium]